MRNTTSLSSVIAVSLAVANAMADSSATSWTNVLPTEFSKEVEVIGDQFAKIQAKAAFTKKLNAILARHTRDLRAAIQERDENPGPEQDRKVTTAMAQALDAISRELTQTALQKVEFQALFGDVQKNLQASIAYLAAQSQGLDKIIPLKEHEAIELKQNAAMLAQKYVDEGKKDRDTRRNLRTLWNQQLMIGVGISAAKTKRKCFLESSDKLSRFAECAVRLEDDVDWACDRMHAYGVAYGKIAESLAVVAGVRNTVQALVGENGLVSAAQDMAKAEGSMVALMSVIDKGVNVMTDFGKDSEDAAQKEAALRDRLRKMHGSFEDWIDDLATKSAK